MTQNEVSDRGARALYETLAKYLPYIDDPEITDVYLNDDGGLWTQRWGGWPLLVEERFSISAAESILRLVAGQSGQEVTTKSPRLAAELPDGTRLQGFIPPVTTRPVFVLRLHRQTNISLGDYVSQEFMTAEAANWIRAALKERRNILIAGPTGTGKTTLANAILKELEQSYDRVAILEDMRELRCPAPNTLSLRSSAAVGLRQLVQDVLRVKPDRIVVGEIRSGIVARELLNAWNTGHPGGLATIHADSAMDALRRLEHLLSEEYQVPPRHLVGRAIQEVLFIGRRSARPYLGSRVTVGWDEEADTYRTEVRRDRSPLAQSLGTDS
ncbi:ATPase, T2SS/T4P/T4SS family [Thalassobaculum litoreum]|uniref:Type IV secretion system protein VirB11 n=1 Tax=Thalassobaculum litoreum DSM 18839 TaxID=1123362 RepID=A0A8G2BME7_9PROT|nr:ATPase, T2SS/T4P/T4SS family [Thalassobaculum litoreum]SDG53908.1 type IV secretion system protein VirB11 [Thalassobaculum litoreum DSM 18839]